MVNGALALPNPVTVLLYRIYIPASGLPLNADVPLPALTLETAAGDVLVPSRAGCSEPVLGTVVNQLAQVDINGALLRVDYPDQLSFVPLRFPTATYPPVTGVFYGLPNTLLQILNHASPVELPGVLQGTELLSGGGFLSNSDAAYSTSAFSRSDGHIRSEERRGGKECQYV